MKDDTIFTEDDISQGEQYGTLGPGYFASRRICEKAMAEYEAHHLKPLVEKIGKEIVDDLWRTIEDCLWSDTELNLQGHMWRQVDEIVIAILSNEYPWIAKRYALGERYDCDKVRRSLAMSIRDELSLAINTDLEIENAQLRKEIEHLKRYR